jgi:hypothetical protein
VCTHLERLADEHLEEGHDLGVEVKQVPVLDLRGPVHPTLSGHEEGRGGPVEEGLGLRVGVLLHGAVGELLQVVVGLCVHVLPAVDRGGRVGHVHLGTPAQHLLTTKTRGLLLLQPLRLALLRRGHHLMHVLQREWVRG